MKKSFIEKIVFIIILSFMMVNLIIMPAFATSESDDIADFTVQQTEDGKSVDNATTIVHTIKLAVAKWYYILRLLAIAIMLLVLIFIGIKLAISNIGDEKALYKRLLKDWLVGMILIFTMHYIMIIIITANEDLVSSLKKYYDTKSNTILEEYEYGDVGEEKKAGEMEETLYKSARTRSYSVKATDGFMGLILYGALVFYAWRFTLIYFKRMLNIMLLIIVSPIVAGTYAINKVVTGKSRIFSTWLSEFMLNVFLQTVHVLLYVSYVQIAYEMAITSIPGLILAFVLMHFMIQAEGLIRKLFKLSGGEGSLGEEAARSNFKSMKAEIQSNMLVQGATGVKMAKAFYKTPVKLAGGAIALGAKTAMTIRANSESYQAKQQAEDDLRRERLEEAANSDKLNDAVKRHKQVEEKQRQLLSAQEENGTKIDGKVNQKAIDDKQLDIAMLYQEGFTDDSQEIIQAKEELEAMRIEQELEENQKELEVSKNDVIEAQKDKEKMAKEFAKREAILNRQTIGGNIADMFKLSNYLEYDSRKGKYKAKNVYSKMKEQMTLANALGIDKKDQKQLKREIKYAKGQIIGTAAGIVGLAGLGVDPLASTMLLAKYSKSFGEKQIRREIARSRSLANGKKYKLSQRYLAPELDIIEKNHEKRNKKYNKINQIDFHNHLAQKGEQNYQLAYMNYKSQLQEEAHQKDAIDLYMDTKAKSMSDRNVKVGNSLITLEKEDKIEECMNKMEEIDQDENLSHAEKVVAFKEIGQEYKNNLVKEEIKKICVEKGITSVNKLVDLKDSEKMTVKIAIVDKLERAGLIEKDELDAEDMGITYAYIEEVKNEMKQESAETNEEIKELIVQDTIMDYIKETGQSEIGDKDKAIIQDKVMDKMLPPETKMTVKVVDMMKQQKNNSEENEQNGESTPLLSKEKSEKDKQAKLLGIDDLLNKNVNQVKKMSRMTVRLTASQFSKERLEERVVTSQTNEAKDIIEEALYTGESDQVDEALLESLFTQIEIVKEANKMVNKVDKNKDSKKKVSNYEIEDKLKYYLEKSEKRKKISEISKVGEEYSSTDDINTKEKSKKLNIELYGPVSDIIDLINNTGKNY